MKDLRELHRKHCPTKSMSNFYRSVDYKAAATAAGSEERRHVPDLVALAFLRWADPDGFYARLAKVLS